MSERTLFLGPRKRSLEDARAERAAQAGRGSTRSLRDSRSQPLPPWLRPGGGPSPPPNSPDGSLDPTPPAPSTGHTKGHAGRHGPEPLRPRGKRCCLIDLRTATCAERCRPSPARKGRPSERPCPGPAGAGRALPEVPGCGVTWAARRLHAFPRERRYPGKQPLR